MPHWDVVFYGSNGGVFVTRPIILVTGTRAHLTVAGQDLVNAALLRHNPKRVLVGDCETGVDSIVTATCLALRIWHTGFTANWYPNGGTRLDRSAGPRRNKRMVEEAAALKAIGETVLGLAFPAVRSRSQSRGTLGCIELARAAGLEVEVTDVSSMMARMGVNYG
jgi:hypothetical protein